MGFCGLASHRLRIASVHVRPLTRPIRTRNAFVESFNGKMREYCLKLHWFASTEDARSTIDLPPNEVARFDKGWANEIHTIGRKFPCMACPER